MDSFWPMEDLDQVSDMKGYNCAPQREIPLQSTRARMVRCKPSLYDPEEDENVECQPGRGLSANRGNLTRRPGGPPSFLENQAETSKSIRAVSGVGYSNDIIEHTLRGSNDNKSNQFDMSMIQVCPKTENSPLKTRVANATNDVDQKFADMSKIQLKPSPSSSSCSTPTNSTLNTTPDRPQTPPKVLKPKVLPRNKVSSLWSNIPEPAAPSRSLFDIIDSANKGSQPKLSNAKVQHIVIPPAVEYHPERIINIYDIRKHTKDKVLDINSPEQFPPLR